jgi:aerobic carbon-monoxide dehydrogenase medium subunit
MSPRNRCDRVVLLREVEYARPSSVDDAIRLLAGHEGARALAGGQTLLNVMKARAASPDVLVDLNRLDGLRGIAVTGEVLEVGAMATYTQLLSSSEVEVACPVLAEVCATIADVQVRNRGTIGGNVCSSDPTNHLPPLMAALGAEMVIVRADGERTVPATDFFLGVYMTAAGPGELLTKIRIPAGRRAAFDAVTLGADGTCIVSAAAVLGDGGVTIALGCVDAVPVVVTATSADEAAVRTAVDGAALDPPADVHASSEYRRHLAGVVAARAARKAGEG